MSHNIRPEDLEAGVLFDVSALGTVPLGQAPTVDIVALQKPMRELYLAYQKPTGTQHLSECRLVVSNRGLALTEATPDSAVGLLPETLYNIPSVVFAAAVKFVIHGKKEKDFKCAFEALDPSEPDASGKGRGDTTYVALDKKWRHLSKITSHPAICAFAIKRLTGAKSLELHAFVSQSDAQARDVIFALTSASRNFTQRDTSSGIYGAHNVYSRIGDADYMMAQQPQQPRMMAPADGMHGFHPQTDAQMMGCRGPEVNKVGLRQELSDPGRPLQGSSEGSSSGAWLNQQKDQLMKNFNEDQRKNEYLRHTATQGNYEQQRGSYEPPKVVYDTQPTPSAIYEYRPPQGNIEPPKDNFGLPSVADGIYGAQRGIYEPPGGARNPGGGGGGGGFETNLYGPTRTMSGSSERVFDEPRNVHDVTRKVSDGSEREADARGFAIPRSKVSYEGGSTLDPQMARRSDSGPSGTDHESSNRPSSLVYDVMQQQPKPASPSPLSTQFPESTIDRKMKGGKMQPAPPPAKSGAARTKTPTSSVTSPTLETGQGPQSLVAPRGPETGLDSPEVQPMSPVDNSPRIVAPRKVTGIKVFPTIMLKGAQAAAIAAAASSATDTENSADAAVAAHPSYPHPASDKQSVIRNRSNPDAPDERRSRGEMESAMAGLTVDQGQGQGHRSSQDFEQSLGYFP